ncbi:MAG: response regulator [Bacteroidales bacterium]
MDKLNNTEILIVEDNHNDAEIAVRAFKQNNLTNNITVVDDGDKALDFIFARGIYAKRNMRNKPKVILLDLKLPRVDGLEVLKQIKSNQETKFIPVIILTSSSEESDMIQSYDLGVNSYIIKPVDFDKFVAAVQNLGLYWLLLNSLPE